MGLRAKGAEVMKVFQSAYLTPLEQINSVYDDAQTSMGAKYSKKHPVNLALADDTIMVTNPKIVDVDWRILHTLSSKNLNKLFMPRFQITLIVLTNGCFKKGGAVEKSEWSSKRET